MNEFREFQEAKEQKSEGLEERLEARTQELLEKADALIESSAELLAEDSLLTKEEIIERNRQEVMEKYHLSEEDFEPLSSDAKSYSPSFGAWTKYDSDIYYKTRELQRDMAAGRKEATKNDLNEIKELEKKRQQELERQEAEKAAKKG